MEMREPRPHIQLTIEPKTQPEVKLICQMVLRAWADYWSPYRLVRVSARNWLNFYEYDAFSFTWCCEQLGLCPHDLRNRIIAQSYNEQVQRQRPDRYKKLYCAM